VSGGRGTPWPQARELVLELQRRLAPHLERVEVAGSVRRMVGLVGDLELVGVPRMAQDLLGPTGEPDLEGLTAELEKLGKRKRGATRYVRYDRVLGSQLSLDLFLVHPPAEWGSIYAIRTGPAALGRFCVQKMRDELGLQHVDGYVRDARTRERRPTPTERDFFELAQVDFVAPEYRASLAQRLGAW